MDELSEEQRKPLSEFLIAYMKQTKRQTMSLPTFLSNIWKAYKSKKFGLKTMIEETHDNEVNEGELNEIVQNVKSSFGIESKKNIPEQHNVETQEKKKPITFESPFKKSRLKKEVNKKSRIAKPKDTIAKNEDRFDKHDFTKMSTSFLAKKAGEIDRTLPADKTFTERLLIQNNIKNVGKNIKGKKYQTSEEKALEACTFKPALIRPKSALRFVPPRVFNHLPYCPTEAEEKEKIMISLMKKQKRPRKISNISSIVGTPCERQACPGGNISARSSSISNSNI